VTCILHQGVSIPKTEGSVSRLVTIKKKFYKDQLFELEEWQYEYIRPFLSKAQKKYKKRYK